MITVVGSLNMDLIAHVERLPAPGETVLAADYARAPGAKGANQAVAAARAGSSVTFVGRVGDDPYGHELRCSLRAAGIVTEHVHDDPHAPTGIALISVDHAGENSIVVVPGANAEVRPADVDAAADSIRQSSLLVMQFEIPLATVAYAARLAHAAGVPVLLNPSPARAHLADLLASVDFLVANQREAAMLAGAPEHCDAAESARMLLDLGPATVAVTRGSSGCTVVTREDIVAVPAFPVTAVDSTGAGDAFLGNFAHAVESGVPLRQAVRLASAAAAWSVRVRGAQPSMPTREQTESILREFERP